MTRNARIWWLKHACHVPVPQLAQAFSISLPRVYQIINATEAKMARTWMNFTYRHPEPFIDRLLAANALEGRLNQGPEWE